MSVNRKLSKEEKQQRRLKELSRASANAGLGYVIRTPEKQVQQSVVQEKHTLPIKEIKRDLWKNLFFTIFAIVLVVSLKITGFGFEQIKHLLSF